MHGGPRSHHLEGKYTCVYLVEHVIGSEIPSQTGSVCDSVSNAADTEIWCPPPARLSHILPLLIRTTLHHIQMSRFTIVAVKAYIIFSYLITLILIVTVYTWSLNNSRKLLVAKGLICIVPILLATINSILAARRYTMGKENPYHLTLTLSHITLFWELGIAWVLFMHIVLTDHVKGMSLNLAHSFVSILPMICQDLNTWEEIIVQGLLVIELAIAWVSVALACGDRYCHGLGFVVRWIRPIRGTVDEQLAEYAAAEAARNIALSSNNHSSSSPSHLSAPAP